MLAPNMIVEGKLEIERVLGRGGMGEVLVARHLHLDQRVAIKVLHAELASNPDVVARFMREARANGRLRSEHVCRVFDVGQLESGQPYFVMELLEGEDLSDLIARSPLSIETAADYVLQACVAVAEAHALGVVHRDLKPANLFITKRIDGSPLVKVLDFGIASAPTTDGLKLTQTATVIGSPGYMSPEHLRSARDVDARSDIWSLGVILYEAVSNRLPFVAETITELAVRVVLDPPAPIGSVDPRYAAIVARCLEKEPAQRYQTVAELADALAPLGGATARASAATIAMLMGRPPTKKLTAASVAPEAPPPATTSGGRKLAVVAALGTAVAAAGIGGVIWWRTSGSGDAPAVKQDASVMLARPTLADAGQVAVAPVDAPHVELAIDAALADDVRELVARKDWPAILKRGDLDAKDPIVVDARKQYLAGELAQIAGFVARGECARATAAVKASAALVPDDTTLAAKAKTCVAATTPPSPAEAGQAQLDHKQYAKALATAEAMLAKDATDTGGLRLATLAECGLAAPDKAREYFAKLPPAMRREASFVCDQDGVKLVPEGRPAPGDAQIAKEIENAQNAWKAGRAQQTLTIAERVLKDRPMHGGALYWATVAACRLKQPDKARDYFAKLPNNSNAKNTAKSLCGRDAVPL